jgi:hypothetical protein
VLWSRLLIAGSRFPSTLGKEILPLSWTLPILIGYDTRTHVGEFLIAIFSTLGRDERERIERAIMRITEALLADRLEAGEYIRNCLLGCLANESIVTVEARSLLVQLKSENAIPSNKPTSSIIREMGRTWGEEEDLADRGVPVEAEANRNIRELERPVKEFADKYLNCEPTLEEVSDILQAIRALHNALSKADADGVHPNQRDYGWHYLAAACARIARTERLSL